MKISAVIFDLDGTVLDNEDEWGEAFRSVLKKLGKEISDKYPQEGGIGVKENWPKLLAKYHVKTEKSLEELESETHRAYLAILPKVTTRNGFEEFAKNLTESGVKLGLATSGTWPIVEATFDKLGLGDTFDAVATAEEVTLKKPSPDLFLLTADKLDARPDECLVIEDSSAGIEAAHEAGMKAVGLARDKKTKETLEDADVVVDDFSSLLKLFS